MAIFANRVFTAVGRFNGRLSTFAETVTRPRPTPRGCRARHSRGC